MPSQTNMHTHAHIYTSIISELQPLSGQIYLGWTHICSRFQIKSMSNSVKSQAYSFPGFNTLIWHVKF